MANELNLVDLQREREKHQAALSGVSEKIAAIEDQQRREREAREAKERELASLRRKHESCQRRWIPALEQKIAELERAGQVQAETLCDGGYEAMARFEDMLQEVVITERKLAAFKDYEVSVEAKIAALARQC